MTQWGVTMRAFALVGLVACGPEHLAPPVGLRAVDQRVLPASETMLVFDADFNEAATGPLVVGTAVRVSFDAARLPQCRSYKYGQPAWGTTAYYRIDGGEVRNVPVVLPNQTLEAWLELDAPGSLEVWFSNSDAYGCIAWDSNYGVNYTFDVLDETIVPAWMGNASWVITRSTCEGSFCEGDLQPLDTAFVYDTWARQRAAVAETTFQVWAPGVTDAASREQVWELLDARIHWSNDGATLEEAGWRWVDLHGFVGNDARYADSIRDLDPLGGNTITDAADCPDVPLQRTADGYYVEADRWFWFSVNGVVLAPETGAWRGTFQDYIGLYTPCL